MELHDVTTALYILQKHNIADDVLVVVSKESAYSVETLMRYIENIGSEGEVGFAACDLFMLYMKSCEVKEDTPHDLVVDCLAKTILSNRDNKEILMKLLETFQALKDCCMILEQEQADAFVDCWMSVSKQYKDDAEILLELLKVFGVMVCTIDLYDAVIRSGVYSYVPDLMGAHTNSVEIQIMGFSGLLFVLGYKEDSDFSDDFLKSIVSHMNEMCLMYFWNDIFAEVVEALKKTLQAKYGVAGF